MKHSIISVAVLAVLALGTQAFAIDKPVAGKQREASAPVAPPGMAIIKPNMTPSGPKGPASSPAPSPPVTKLTSAKFLPAEIFALDSVQMKFDGVNLGAGKDCGGKVTWGDGSVFDNTLASNGAWRTINKTFAKAGSFVATVTPTSYSGNPCTSDAPVTVAFTVKPPKPLPPSMMTKLVVTPMLDPKVRLISTKWVGSAPNSACSYTLNFGDGKSIKSGAGPIQPGSDEHHVYVAGTYSVIISPSNADYDSCTLGPDAGPKTFTVE